VGFPYLRARGMITNLGVRREEKCRPEPCASEEATFGSLRSLLAPVESIVHLLDLSLLEDNDLLLAGHTALLLVY
jgi:hypothetical protein